MFPNTLSVLVLSIDLTCAGCNVCVNCNSKTQCNLANIVLYIICTAIVIIVINILINLTQQINTHSILNQGRWKQLWVDPVIVWGFIWLVAKGNSAAHARGVWGHAPPGKI